MYTLVKFFYNLILLSIVIYGFVKAKGKLQEAPFNIKFHTHRQLA
jgi:hypothetical protein